MAETHRTEKPLTDEELLAAAIAEARRGLSEGGIPIGAVLAHEGRILGGGHNRRVQLNSAIRHGETDCLENIGRLPASVYATSTMVTTLSPCDMCTGAILLYGIPRVVVGESTNFYGGEDLLVSRGVEVVVLDNAECIEMMEKFIAGQFALWNEDIGEPAAE
ncbi:MAG: nucleoside deaminase [Actinomycetota bacterium]|nr:nucleoside deaminase [Actinomycetota bacterium]